MKKIILIISLSLLPFIASAQSIKDSGIDEFTDMPIIFTSWTGLGVKAVLPSKGTPSLEFKIRYENEIIYFHLKWNNSPNITKKDSKLQFRMNDNSIVTLLAIDDFDADLHVYTYLEQSRSQNIMYAVYTGDLSAFANGNLVDKIRISTIYGAKTLELDTKNALKISKAYNLILDEIEKY